MRQFCEHFHGCLIELHAEYNGHWPGGNFSKPNDSREKRKNFLNTMPQQGCCRPNATHLGFSRGLLMNDTRIPTFLFCLMVVLGVLQCVHVYSQLPAVMASHFTGRGIPNGWQPKPAFFFLIGVVMLLSAIPAFIVPRGLPTMPPEKINLPNKDYWLAPERREETWRFFSVQMAWWGCALLFLLLYAMTLAINANLPSVGYFDWQGMWHALGGFLLFTVLWIVHLLQHFYKIPPSGISPPTGR